MLSSVLKIIFGKAGAFSKTGNDLPVLFFISFAKYVAALSASLPQASIFKLVKFRTMSNKKDENGELLPDEVRLNKYGRFLRSTSLDELPELWNILKGDMSIVGPRPLLVKYLPRYTEEQRRRHDVRPGFTGLAQINGRNAISWEKKFEYDVQYVENVTFFGDCKIIFQTVGKVLKRDGISSDTSSTMEEFMGNCAESVTHE